MSLFHAALQTALDDDGNPIEGATWAFYKSGTSTPKAVYADFAYAVSLGDTVTADATGRFVPIYLEDGAKYRVVLKDALGATIAEIDPYNPDTVTMGLINVRDYGAVGDGETDDSDAFEAAIEATGTRGGSVFIPKSTGAYRLTRQIVANKYVQFYGDGWTDNPGIVQGVTYPHPTGYAGSVLWFDTDVAGFLFLDLTDEIDTNTVVADYAAHYDFQTSRRSILRDMALLGTASDAETIGKHGVEIRSVVHVENVLVRGFAGKGVYVRASADTTSTDSAYGNSSMTSLKRVYCYGNNEQGFHLLGRDVNVCHLDLCNAQRNLGVGFLDDGLLGNHYTACHANSNNFVMASSPGAGDPTSDAYEGSFVTTSEVAAHTFIGCYTESGIGSRAVIKGPAVIFGGNLASDTALSADTDALVFNGGATGRPGRLTRSGLVWLNTGGDVDVVGGFSAGGDGTKRDFLRFGISTEASDIAANPPWGVHNGLSGADDWYSVSFNNDSAETPFMWPSSMSRRNEGRYGFATPEGQWFGNPTNSDAPFVYYDSANPTTGTWHRNSIRYSNAMAASTSMGAACVQGGTYNVDIQLALFLTNGVATAATNTDQIETAGIVAGLKVEVSGVTYTITAVDAAADTVTLSPTPAVTVSGEAAPMVGSTGSITSGSTTLTATNCAPGTGQTVARYGFMPGQYIAIAGVTGTKRITAVNGNTITIDSAADATVSNAAVSFVAPVWKSLPSLAA